MQACVLIAQEAAEPLAVVLQLLGVLAVS